MQTKMQNEIFKGKKGINDISIIAVIASVFILTGIIIPFVNSTLGTDISTFDNDQFESNVKQTAQDASESSVTSSISAFKVLTNVLKLAFFDFGDTLGVPFWLDILYTILAIIFVLVIARNIWVGGGA
jgi:hypothetical protein|tara:strand:- start:336 stop:719 length:384 start_codon:yes stop_codon:yes gene_type:complete